MTELSFECREQSVFLRTLLSIKGVLLRERDPAQLVARVCQLLSGCEFIARADFFAENKGQESLDEPDISSRCTHWFKIEGEGRAIGWLKICFEAAPAFLEELKEISEEIAISWMSISEKSGLRERERLLGDILDALPGMAWLKDPHGVYLQANANLADLVQRKKADFPGKSDYDFFPKDKADFYRHHDLQAMEAGCTTSNEESADFLGEGYSQWLETLKTPIQSEDGKLIGIFGYGRLLSGIHEPLHRAKEREGFLELIVDQSPLPMWVGSRSGTALRANHAFYDFLGLTPSLVVGRYSLHQDGNFNLEMISQVFEEMKPVRFDLPWRSDLVRDITFSTPRKLHLDVSISPILNSNGKISHIIIQYVDITDFIEAKRMLQETSEHLREAQEVAHFGSWEMDIEGQWIHWSDETFRIFGLPPDKAGLSFESFMEMVHPDDEAEIHHLAERLASNGEATFEYRAIRRDQEVRWIKGQGKTNYNLEGAPARFFGALQDVTAERALESQLRHSQRLESIGRLAGGVAHDFNNMLGVILGNTELALEVIDDSHSLYENLKQIQRAGRRSCELTRQLLAFARKQTVSPVVTNLNDSLSSITKILDRLIGENIQFLWETVEDLWPVKIDPSQVDQILTNLCVNARDAIQGDGQIWIETSNQTLVQEDIKNAPELKCGDYIKVVVKDSGCGMDKKTLEKIFEPFFTTKNQRGGTGLGLSMVYGVVKQNHGFIQVLSSPGLGTSFEIFLPRYQGKVVSRWTRSASTLEQKGNETILLVEDEDALLEMTAVMLEIQGYKVLKTTSPVEALRLAREQAEIQLLITDVVMPKMTGRELRRSVEETLPSVKCLYMSGYTEDIIARHGVLDEGIHFIQKPFTYNELITKVRKALDAP